MRASSYWSMPVNISQAESADVHNRVLARVEGPVRTANAQVVTNAVEFLKFLTNDVEIEDRNAPNVLAPITPDGMKWVFAKAGSSIPNNVLEIEGVK